MSNVTENPVETNKCCAEGVSVVLDKARAAFTGARDTILRAAPIENARAGARAIDYYVHKSPWSLIGGVAVLALAVGILLRRR